ncbi:MAG: alanine--glyoxylate aminotransferase family protein [Treponema sp.]|nr:alanine--glyoxylate aminotransferase family protein [Treponema sp.]
MINFTVGPVQMDKETLNIGSKQIPYFRTPDFSELLKENEKLLCKMFDAPNGSRVIFMTGSGTSSMEGGVINFFSKSDKVLVVNGGSFGHRFVEICKIHNIPFTEIKLNYGEVLTEKHLSKFENQGYTGFLVQLCETSTGVLYDMDLIANFSERNKLFLFVDAVSGFMADDFSMSKMHVNAVITGSQKALSLPPGMSFTVMDETAVARCKDINVESLYFNYPTYLLDGERGQTPFTPAVGTLIQLNEKLKRIESNGGIQYQLDKAKRRARYFRDCIRNLPFVLFVDGNNASNCVTALSPKNPNVNAYKIFEILKNEYNIWVCPNGGDLSDKVFRVGHIGSISDDDIDALICAFNDLEKRGLL